MNTRKLDKMKVEENAKKQILQDLNMSEACLEQAIENVKSWLQHQPHLPHDLDSAVVKSFVIGCRSVEVAKEKLQNYFMARINYPYELSDRDPMKIKWETIQPLAILPELTPDGYIVLFLTMPDLTKMSQFDFLQTIRYVAMMFELTMRQKPNIAGQICVVDLKHLTLKLVPKVSLTYLADALYLFDHAYPFLMKAIYNFNTPQIADSLQRTLIKPFMSDGLYNMIISETQDERCLGKYIPMDILPADYGGKAPPLIDIMNNWKMELENSKKLFTEECACLPDMSKMPKKMLENSNFGSSGTFRKLNVD